MTLVVVVQIQILLEEVQAVPEKDPGIAVRLVEVLMVEVLMVEVVVAIITKMYLIVNFI